MKKIAFILIIMFIGACAENLLEKPDNLIAKEKMVDILNDLAILNAAKNSNSKVLIQHGLDPMPFIYTKYDIDSLQFVNSDRYYASLPEEHEKIYLAVEAKLNQEKERLISAKSLQDSLNKIKAQLDLEKRQKIKDSLLKNIHKKVQ